MRLSRANGRRWRARSGLPELAQPIINGCLGDVPQGVGGLAEARQSREKGRGEITAPGQATVLLPSREHGPVRLPGEGGRFKPYPFVNDYSVAIPADAE